MSYRTDDKLANFAALDKNTTTRVIALAVAAAANVTPTQLAVGHYMCRVPNGTAADTVTGKLLTAGTAVADTTLDLPSSGAAAETMFSAPGDAWFPLYVDTAAPYLAAIWSGGGASTLILTRVGP